MPRFQTQASFVNAYFLQELQKQPHLKTELAFQENV